MKERINLNKIPKHIAIIMDGNGRWAKKKGAMRIFGHRNAIEAVRQTAEGAAKIGVKYLTLYAFSTENWNRPSKEIEALMQLLISTIQKELGTLMNNNIVLDIIGNLEKLPIICREKLKEAIERTKPNNGMRLILALSYGGRKEIIDACKEIIVDYIKTPNQIPQIDERIFENYLYTKTIPHPEMMIRTSGEHRVSNFLLWQLAYAELIFIDTLWPDFREEDLYRAIAQYQERERRFGKISEQITPRFKS